MIYQYLLLGDSSGQDFASHNDMMQLRQGFNFRLARGYHFIDVSDTLVLGKELTMISDLQRKREKDVFPPLHSTHLRCRESD